MHLKMPKYALKTSKYALKTQNYMYIFKQKSMLQTKKIFLWENFDTNIWKPTKALSYQVLKIFFFKLTSQYQRYFLPEIFFSFLIILAKIYLKSKNASTFFIKIP